MNRFVEEYIAAYQGKACACGKVHTTPIEDVIVGKGVLAQLPEVLSRYNSTRPFVLADPNTFRAAGEQVCGILEQAGLPYAKYIFADSRPEPDEKAVGSAVMHFDHGCDAVVAVGSGVVNDIAKILAKTAKVPFVIVATAPSMDGYASDSSSMAMDGLKVSLYSGAANVIIGDVDILKKAPLPMLKAGLGDMLAKYVSIAEWKIARLLLGEYYCESVVDLVNTALEKCVANAEGLLRREEAAVQAVFEGLVISGLAMNYAEISRPASGMEHYISHIWDMRFLSFGTPVDSHGVQCAIGTVYTLRLYEKLKELTPDRDRALSYVASFDLQGWYDTLRTFIGGGAEAMIAQDGREKKYDAVKHAARLEIILEHWEEILQIADALPSSAEIEALLKSIDAPTDMEQIGLSRDILPLTLMSSKDIRDKYVLTRLLWDLGVLEETVTVI